MGNRRSTLVAAGAVALAILAGCGGDGEGASDEDEVFEVAESFAQAGAANDYATFCALLTDAARAPIEEFARTRLDVPEDQRCEAGLEASGGPPEPDAVTEVANVSVDGDTAEADITNTFPDQEPVTRTLTLQRQQSGEWLIADYGGP